MISQNKIADNIRAAWVTAHKLPARERARKLDELLKPIVESGKETGRLNRTLEMAAERLEVVQSITERSEKYRDHPATEQVGR